jgi:hypothetical protein
MLTDRHARGLIGNTGRGYCATDGFGYPAVMGEALRRFLVALIAVAFVAGTQQRSAMGLTAADPCPLSGNTHTMAHQPMHSTHEHHGAHSHHHTADKREPVKHEGIKCFCYGISGFNVLPSAPASDVVFQTKSISFAAIVKTFNGRSIVLDPGIPKRIA